ncbi:peptidase family M1 [Ancylostoma duodenale]|uniref:Peptidase family M1 n=1 Tax=Ancylostoma duodenale TaxID=51022 RepID=A0A0C2DLR6_9BILA|nr:peptidase family M1 [Ancylostoma duodenale]
MTFTVKEETSEIVVNAHRLIINTDSVALQNDRNERIEVSSTEINKDFENGILTIPVVGKLSPGNSYTLSISYFGSIFDKPFHQGPDINYNFYEFNGKQGWIFTTDFEGGPGSRSLLVCCDEPAYKAKFKISVRHPADMTALSNMINTGTVVSKDGWAVTSFKESPLMVQKEKLKVMAGTVDYMTKYFNYEFPLSKLDMVALPQHADTGAMENWGLILGNYKSMMVDMDYADANALGRVAIVVAREVVHQWFGNLVTLDWWSDIFLNEGFAQYWSHYGMTYTLPEQKGYMEHYRFISTTKALINDCKENTWPILSVEGGLFTTAAYLKACNEDKIKGWDGKPLDVSTLMKAWTTEKSFPILKVEHSLKTGKVTYNQESCLGTKNSNTSWYIPVRSEQKGGDGEELNWFYGKDGSSPSWTMSYPPRRIDNVRRTAFVRMQYDTRTWASLIHSIRIAKDPITVGTILDDAWFFLSKEVYSWSQFLDLARAIDWDTEIIPWNTGLKLMEKLYSSFRYNDKFKMIWKYLIRMGEWQYLALAHSTKPPSPYWDHRILGGELYNWMCRLNHPECLKTAETQFNRFVTSCSNSYSGTAHCVNVIPDFRRTMYCYGLRQNPGADTLVYSLYKYFAVNAFYFNRDGGKLLYGLSCLSDTSKLEK